MIFLVPSLEQPRVVKRIVDTSKKVDRIKIYGFTRTIYRVNNFEKLQAVSNIELKIIDAIDTSKYTDRLKGFLKLLYIIYKEWGGKKKDIYVFGLDLRMLSFFMINSRVTYEISDIVWLYRHGIVKRIMKNIDFFMTRLSEQVVFTSEGFYRKHYQFLKKEKVKILENKFKSYNKAFPIQKIKLDRVRIAYIGAFRYEAIMNYLIDIVSQNKNIDLRFYGDGPVEIVNSVKTAATTNSNIYYSGAFKNPEDLEPIYADNNINFVAYDNTLGNEKVLMPNKYYESGYFNIPIVGSTNTFVGEKIKEMNMGWVIDSDKKGIETFINSITIQEIEMCHNKIKTLDKSNFESPDMG